MQLYIKVKWADTGSISDHEVREIVEASCSDLMTNLLVQNVPDPALLIAPVARELDLSETLPR